METIHAKNLIELIKNKDVCLLDVRSADEHSFCHLETAQLVPLDQLEQNTANIPKDRPLYIICHSGNRSLQAIKILKSLGYENLIHVVGGIKAFEKEGGKLRKPKKGIPLMRQVQIIAGALVLGSTLLSVWVSPYFLFLTGFVGAGLMTAGISGFCGMAKILFFMPWNQPKPSCSLQKTPGKS